MISIQAIWEDGIFRVGNKFSKTYLRQNRANFEQSILMPMRADGLDEYRREYNQMLIGKANGITQEKHVTASVNKQDVEAARAYFARIEADLSARFAALDSKCVELNTADCLHILHNIYRAGEEENFHFDMADMARKGHDFKDYGKREAGNIAVGSVICWRWTGPMWRRGSNGAGISLWIPMGRGGAEGEADRGGAGQPLWKAWKTGMAGVRDDQYVRRAGRADGHCALSSEAGPL